MYERTGDLINRKFMQYLIPTMFMSMALSLGTIVDGIIVSNILGTDALAAINLCTPVIMGFSAIYSILGVGGSTLVSTAMGRREKKKANQIFSMSLLFLLIAGILVTLIGFVFLNGLVGFITKGSDLFQLVKEYVEVYIYGAVLFFLTPGIAYFIRADGGPRLSAVILVSANAVNLCMDVVYIKVFHMGIQGAALASLTGYAVGLLLTGIYFVSKNRTLKFARFEKNILHTLEELVVTGLPSALNSILMFIKITVVNSVALAALGTIGATAVAICNNCLSIAAIFIGGAAQTMLPIMAVLYGEEDHPGMKLAVKKAIYVVLSFSIIMLVLLEAAAGGFIRIFGVNGSDPVLYDTAVKAVRIFCISLPLYGMDYILMCFYQATGRKELSVFVTVVQGIVFIVPFVLILSSFMGANGIWASFVLAECATFLTIWLVSMSIGKKEKARGLFLDKDQKNPKELDITLVSSVDKALELSDQVIEFCEKNGASKKICNYVGIAIEEMAVNTIEYGYSGKGNKHIDINLKIMEDQILIRFRDDGVPFNPVEYQAEEIQKLKTHGIEIVRSMSKSIEYSRVLGFNNTVLKLAK